MCDMCALKQQKACDLVTFTLIPTVGQASLVSVPLVRCGLLTSGSDEPNWKHMLHVGCPEIRDSMIILITERKRREGERNIRKENPLS